MLPEHQASPGRRSKAAAPRARRPFVRKPVCCRLLAQLLDELFHILAVDAGCEHLRHSREVWHLAALRNIVHNLALLTSIRLRSVPDLTHLPVVVGAEAVQEAVITLVHEFLGVRELLALYIRYG